MASAASSISSAPCFSQISLISRIPPGNPYSSAHTTSLTSGYISKAFSKAAGSMFQVSGFVSIKTGIPPSYSTGFKVASKVISEQNTRLPSTAPWPTAGRPYSFSPASFTHRCSAAVQAERATAYFTPAFSAAIRSTSLIFAPTVLIQLVS